MDGDDTLPERARELVDSGRLPRNRPHQVRAVTGSGKHRCLMCRALIAAEQTGFEVEFKTAGGSTSDQFHVRCFWTFESEWRRLGDVGTQK